VSGFRLSKIVQADIDGIGIYTQNLRMKANEFNLPR
jgi:hypothetical protein